MRIREYTSGDFAALRQMHAAQGFGYPLPDLESPLFVSKLVLEEDDADDAPAANGGAEGREEAGVNSPLENSNGEASSCVKTSRIAMAILQRLTAETYLLHDPTAGTPRQRWEQFVALHNVARREAAAKGLDDVQAFLPPGIALAFGRRLTRLGWTRDPWPCFSLRV